MKPLLHALLFSLLCVQASAQITLTAASFEVNLLADSSAKFVSANFPVFQTGDGQSWNFGTHPVESWDYVSECGPADAAHFPDAQYAQYSRFEFNGGLGYNCFTQQSILPDAWYRYGEVLSRQANTLVAVTGNPTDSLIFPAQWQVYSAPDVRLPFPATTGASVSSSYLKSTNFQLRIPLFGFNYTPGERRAYQRTDIEVVGSGTLRLPVEDGGISQPYEVLMVRYKLVSTDSFYLNGQPAPPQLIAAFGLVQGQRDSSTATLFYAADNRKQPLLDVIHANGNWGQQVSFAFFQTEGIVASVSTDPEPEWAADFAANPNPVADLLRVNIPSVALGGRLHVLDAQGRIILQKEAVSTTEDINLAAQPAGMYFVQYRSEKGQVTRTVVKQ